MLLPVDPTFEEVGKMVKLVDIAPVIEFPSSMDTEAKPFAAKGAVPVDSQDPLKGRYAHLEFVACTCNEEAFGGKTPGRICVYLDLTERRVEGAIEEGDGDFPIHSQARSVGKVEGKPTVETRSREITLEIQDRSKRDEILRLVVKHEAKVLIDPSSKDSKVGAKGQTSSDPKGSSKFEVDQIVFQIPTSP